MGQERQFPDQKRIITTIAVSTFIILPILIFLFGTILSQIPRFGSNPSDAPIIGFSTPIAILVIALIWKRLYEKSNGKEFSRGILISGVYFAIVNLLSFLLGGSKMFTLGSNNSTYMIVNLMVFPAINYGLSRFMKNEDVKKGMLLGYTYLFLLILIAIISGLYQIE